jgi:hypothetical protein
MTIEKTIEFAPSFQPAFKMRYLLELSNDQNSGVSPLVAIFATV